MDARRFLSGQDEGTWGHRVVKATRRTSPVIENLESRQLLTGIIMDVATLPESVKVGPMAVNVDGSVWFAERNADGSGVNQIARLTPGGFRSEFALPASAGPRTIGALTPDGKGAMWLTSNVPASAEGTSESLGSVAKMDESGVLTEFKLPSTGDRPGSAVAAADGGLWLALTHPSDGATILKMAPDGGTKEFPVEGATSLTWLTLGKNGNIWFVNGERIGTMTPAGEVQMFDLPAPADGSKVDLSNAHLTTASDGNIWFLGLGGLNRITPTGDLKSYPSPTTSLTSLSTASDGNLWFSFLPPATGAYSDSPGALVARMTPDGRTTVVPEHVDSTGHPVLRMVSGNDAAIWLDEGGSIVSRLSLASVPNFTAPIIRPTTRSFFTIEPGKAVQGTIVSFVPNLAEASPRTYAATIEWGDGGAEAAKVVRNASGDYEVLGSHVYTAEPDSWMDIKVTIKDDSGGISVIFNRVHLQTPTLAPTPVPSTPDPGPWRNFPNRPVRPNVPATPTPAAPSPNGPGNPIPAGNITPVNPSPTTPRPGLPVTTPVSKPTPTPTPITARPPTPTRTPTPARPTTTTGPVDPYASFRRPGLMNETLSMGRLPRSQRFAALSTTQRPPARIGLAAPRGPIAQFPRDRLTARLPRR